MTLPTPANAGTPVRYVFLDALRGLASLSVVLFHSKAGHHVDALLARVPGIFEAVVGHGDLGVQVFFVLSGFVIAHSMSRQQVTWGFAGRFLLRRSIRLDPPYWASMAFIVLLGVLFSRFIPGKTYGVPSGTEVLIHVLYLEDLLHIPFINPVYWTLCLEIQFYLVFCALMLIVTMFRRWMSSDRAFYAVLLPAMVISDLWPLHVPLYNREGLFLGHWHLFIAGVIVYGSVARPGIRYPAVIAFANLAVLAVAASLRTDKELAMGVVCALVILFADQRGKLSVWLGSRPFQILGAVSYSLYLFHNPLTGAFYRIGYRMTGRSIVWEGFWFVLATAGCVAAACFFYWIIEKPSMTLSRRIRLSP